MNRVVERELILGGQKSGKSRLAETRAMQWLGEPDTNAVLLATALPGDPDMIERIARHRRDRLANAPGLQVVECAHDLPARVAALSAPRTLLIIDCITLWLTQQMMPVAGAADDAGGSAGSSASGSAACNASGNTPGNDRDGLLAAIAEAKGPVIAISNEISLGVVPLGRECREFIDALGMLHQRLALACTRVTLMVAGCEVTVKGSTH